MVEEWRDPLAVDLVLASAWRKVRQEEICLGKHCGEPYRRYQARARR